MSEIAWLVVAILTATVALVIALIVVGACIDLVLHVMTYVAKLRIAWREWEQQQKEEQ